MSKIVKNRKDSEMTRNGLGGMEPGLEGVKGRIVKNHVTLLGEKVRNPYLRILAL